MSKSQDQSNIRTVLPADGEPFKDRVELFKKPSEETADSSHAPVTPHLCEIGKDLGDPLLEPGRGVVYRIIARLTNWLRRLSE